MSPSARISRQEWYDQIAVRVAAAQELLASKLSELRSGQDWKRYLTFQARLHHYSPNNATLIYFQHAHAYAAGLVSEPEPSCIAGHRTWKALGRTVERGQHGYAILAPVAVPRREATNPHGTIDGFTPGDSANTDDTESVNRVVRGFKIEHVFDVSQTRGRPIPRPVGPKLLAGQAPKGFAESMMALIQSHGYHVDTVSSAGEIDGANGVTNWSSRQVTVRNDMDEAAIVKTLAHEAAHILLHEKPPGRGLPRQLKEVEAESVAYVGHFRPRDGQRRLFVPVYSDLGGRRPGQRLAGDPDPCRCGGQNHNRLQFCSPRHWWLSERRRSHSPLRTIAELGTRYSGSRVVKLAG
jgi:hypothetical protein